MFRNVKVRIVLVLLIGLAPVLFLCGVGLYHLWQVGWAFYAWWPMAGCLMTAYGLTWYWTRRKKESPIEVEDVEKPGYWTTRDQVAWSMVEEYARTAPPPSKEEWSNVNRFAKDAQTVALSVTKVYRPHATDPFGHLTIPEILACAELIAHDLAQLVDKYIPGSHVLSINNFRAFKTAADWYEKGRNIYWAASLMMDPLRAGMQILATKAGLQPTFKNIQKNILGWLYTAYLQELGRYLIELNSGRLKVGAKRYRELRDQLQEPPSADGPAIDPAAGKSADRITIAIVGPTKAGKSSLANALLGEERAAVDVVPLTATTTRYDLTQPSLPGLTLLDTVGFAQDGATDADLAAAVDVAASADILLLVAPARSAARVPEVEFLQRLVQQFEARPELKLPPVLLALTKIDLLPPAIEWQPPYEWQSGSRPKEVAVRDAINAAKELFPTQIIECVPLCTATGKVHGVRETLLPLLAAQLSEARGVAMLRMLHAEGSADQVQRLIGQAVNVGKELFRQWWRPGKV